MQTRGFVLLWILLAHAPVLAESTATCNVPSVPRGTPTHVTCHFSEDLVQTQKAFAIHRYDKKEHFEEILNCPWIADRHICDPLSGYEFDGRITDEVTLKIPSASEENVGRYVCQVVPSDTDDLAPCSFTLKESTTVTVILTEDTSATFKEQEDDEDGSLVPILVTLVLLLLLIAALVVIVIYFRKRLRVQIRKLCASSKRKKYEEDSQEEREYGAQFETDFLDRGSRSESGEPEYNKPDMSTETDEEHKAEVTPLLGSTVEEASSETPVSHEHELKEPKGDYSDDNIELSMRYNADKGDVTVEKHREASPQKAHDGLPGPENPKEDSKQPSSFTSDGTDMQSALLTPGKGERLAIARPPVGPQYNGKEPTKTENSKLQQPSTKQSSIAGPLAKDNEAKQPDQTVPSNIEMRSRNVPARKEADKSPLTYDLGRPLSMEPLQVVSGSARNLSEPSQGDFRPGLSAKERRTVYYTEKQSQLQDSVSSQPPEGKLGPEQPTVKAGASHTSHFTPDGKVEETKSNDGTRVKQKGRAPPPPGQKVDGYSQKDHMPEQQSSKENEQPVGSEHTQKHQEPQESLREDVGKDEEKVTKNVTKLTEESNRQPNVPLSETINTAQLPPSRWPTEEEQHQKEDVMSKQSAENSHAPPPSSARSGKDSNERKEKHVTTETGRAPPTGLSPETEGTGPVRAPARKRDTKELFTAISANDVENVRKLLDKGVNVNSRDTDGDTPLHVACRHGLENVLEILLERGADIKAKNNHGLMPLHWACKYGKTAIVNLLISRGASVKAVGEDGATALHLACQNGLKAILEILLEAGSEIEAKDKSGLTSLHWACKYGKTAAIETLIDYGADVNARGNDGPTPFHIACENGQDAVLKILLKNGYDVDAKDKQGMTALGWACKHGKAPLAKMLLDKGADPNARAEDGTTPLHVASQTGKEGVIETLLTAGSDIEATDKTGLTPLHWACKTGQETSVKTLLAHGSKVNAREQDDWTPLHLACQKGSKEIVLLLHKHNADVEAKTLQLKRTPKDVAKRCLNKDIVELMRELSKK